MLIEDIAFYAFSAILLASAFMVVVARNPVHSVFFLILTFFNAAGLFVLLGAEFLAMILVVVYVGAVAVLFLFVVMMLDVDFTELKRGTQELVLVGGGIGLLLLGELIGATWLWKFAPAAPKALAHPAPSALTNTEAIGRILYTDYIYYFQIAGLVLLVAMIGAIVLTLRHRPGVRRQDISKQNARTMDEAMTLVGLGHYLFVAAMLFTIGVFGIFLNRKNIIVILMSIELILLAVNINFVAFSSFLHDLVGQVFALFILTVAAAEAAIGLAILVVYFRNRGTIAVDDVNLMKG
jgi:NADH-quinone oxidoreductase subunit J